MYTVHFTRLRAICGSIHKGGKRGITEFCAKKIRVRVRFIYSCSVNGLHRVVLGSVLGVRDKLGIRQSALCTKSTEPKKDHLSLFIGDLFSVS